jgi:hypothetical protein
MSDRFGATIDVTIDGEYAEEREVKLVMTTAQFRSLVKRLKDAGDDGTSENWAAIDAFVEAFDSVENDIVL